MTPRPPEPVDVGLTLSAITHLGKSQMWMEADLSKQARRLAFAKHLYRQGVISEFYEYRTLTNWAQP